jgi:hypothetical protein
LSSYRGLFARRQSAGILNCSAQLFKFSIGMSAISQRLATSIALLEDHRSKRPFAGNETGRGHDLMKKIILMAAACAAMMFAVPVSSWAGSVEARVSISKQTMTVTRQGRVLYKWKVSTARRGYVTPRGTWRPKRMHKMWYSRKYEMSPMPYSVFYHGGYAVHGTGAVKQLGRPASHGCVRLQTANAATFYSLVREVGMGNTRIVVTN